VNDAQRDRLLGIVGAAFALAYIAQARGIEDSLLADAVGAGGVPQAAGIVMLLASLALVAKGLLRRTPAAEPSEALSPRRLAIGAVLVLALIGYVLLLPLLGGIVMVSALVLVVALLAGARDRLALALFTALAGVVLWAVFSLALKVRVPSGSIWG